MNELEEARFYLERLGLTQYEAKVYLALLAEHPATAYTISRHSRVPHSRVYEVARRLIAKDLVIQSDTDPERFSPIPPDDLIDKLVMDHDRAVEGLKDQLEQISFRSDFEPVWTVPGRDEAIEKAREIIATATERIYIGIWDEEMKELLDEIRGAAARGVEIVFLIYGTMRVDVGSVFYHSVDAITDRHQLGRSIDIVVDSRTALSGRLGRDARDMPPSGTGDGNSSSCQVVWTKNQGLINAIEGYIIHDFYLAEIYQALGDEIEDIFGKNMTDLRRRYRT
ncbi:MAG: TrmB family transcriptional regulator [Deltaproteobacteria bacterium]|nr:TrmB family transcriptional regulator [Candidatus Zymogenaceae bacterium]